MSLVSEETKSSGLTEISCSSENILKGGVKDPGHIDSHSKI